MSSSIRPTTIALATVGALATGFLGEEYAPQREDAGSVFQRAVMQDPMADLLPAAYAFYFDHKRRTDPEFRKALKRESRRIAKAAKEEAEAQGAQQKRAIRQAVDDRQEEGFPTTVEDKESFFMNMVGQGEALCQNGQLAPLIVEMLTLIRVSEAMHLEAALCFYSALKVYPQPSDLVAIYDKTCPKPVIDILAEMVAYDGSMPLSGLGGGSGSDAGGAVDD
ncbi:MAG: hypothetical protein LQ344_000632 [Seirophora lacunosa]|nr:MAG: hypothetical protein LQ344_000632 [Seirophora lacunosa]